MRFYQQMLHKLARKHMSKNDFLSTKKEIDKVVAALEKMFKEDGGLPLFLSLGIVQVMDNYCKKNKHNLNKESFVEHFIGCAILYAKSSIDQAIWTVDFSYELRSFKLKTLLKFEAAAFKALNYKVAVDIRGLEELFNNYASHESMLDFQRDLSTYPEKGNLKNIDSKLIKTKNIARSVRSHISNYEDSGRKYLFFKKSKQRIDVLNSLKDSLDPLLDKKVLSKDDKSTILQQLQQSKELVIQDHMSGNIFAKLGLTHSRLANELEQCINVLEKRLGVGPE
jgi:hypothetical protein